MSVCFPLVFALILWDVADKVLFVKDFAQRQTRRKKRESRANISTPASAKGCNDASVACKPR